MACAHTLILVRTLHMRIESGKRNLELPAAGMLSMYGGLWQILVLLFFIYRMSVRVKKKYW